MLKKVYVETTVVSYLTARASRDDALLQDQEATKLWWSDCLDYCELFASVVVAREASRGDSTAAKERMDFVYSMTILKPDANTKRLARRFVKLGAIPDTEKEDALHVAIATAYGMDYLVTWNLRHIKNPVKRAEIEKICRKAGFQPPIICTPADLYEANHDQSDS